MTLRPGDRGSATPAAADIDRMERALGWRPTSFRTAVADRGDTQTAARWIVSDGDGSGRSAFVKIGATPITADWTRVEARTYGALRGPFMARALGFDDDGERPALALEDLSTAGWPPPWTDAGIGAVLDAFRAIAATEPPGHLAEFQVDQAEDWRAVADDPAPFLSLGLCSADWLRRALPLLTEAAASAPLAGTSLIHADVRSDNLCFRDGRAVVIDWNHAALANPQADIAFWLPSLHAEGGPAPETILPGAPGLAAWTAGYFCARAGLPEIPEAGHVRRLQRSQARTALPWVARALELPAPG